MCGEVRYRFEGEVFGAANCHCVSCRRAAGAAGVQWVFVERGGFAVTRGTPVEFISSPGATRSRRR